MSFAWHEIRDHLVQTSSTLGFQRNFEVLRRQHRALMRFADPAALLDALHRGAGTPDDKNVILIAAVEAAQSDGPRSRQRVDPDAPGTLAGPRRRPTTIDVAPLGNARRAHLRTFWPRPLRLSAASTSLASIGSPPRS